MWWLAMVASVIVLSARLFGPQAAADESSVLIPTDPMLHPFHCRPHTTVHRSPRPGRDLAPTSHIAAP